MINYTVNCFPTVTMVINNRYMGMDQYLLIHFLVGWTSIYQLFWCSPEVQGFDKLPYIYIYIVTMVCEVVRKSVRFFPKKVCFSFGLAVGAPKHEVICHAYAESRHTNSAGIFHLGQTYQPNWYFQLGVWLKHVFEHVIDLISIR